MTTGGFSATVKLVGTRTSVRRARQFAQDLLGEGHPAMDDVVLVVSELVTNSITHSLSGERGTVTLTIGNSDNAVRVEVTDEGSAASAPHMRDEPDAEGGRGLQIINILAKEWGVTHRGTNVTTWCELPTAQPWSP
ncbi:ATP-binding protein [Sphaerisporangium dianthi]|uniref:ATP-binding protein n=1 Tax=Sphaerisporangium dianthi TaxID=1436120 RepID=A0ABV9CMS0_9ACTN